MSGQFALFDSGALGPMAKTGIVANPPSTQSQQGVAVAAPYNIVRTGGSEIVLTSGSDLDRTAIGPWPGLLSNAIKLFNSWRFNLFRQTQVVKIGANYGGETSQANFGFRHREFNGVGSMPGPVPVATRPMWNNMVPIAYNLQVVDPAAQAQMSDLIQVQTLPAGGSASFQPGGPAQLTETLL